MKYKYFNLFSILFGFLLFIIAASRVQAAVVINEFLPKVEDSGAQFIELYNNGNDAVSLDRWKIEQTGGDKKSFTLNASALVQAKSFLVITGAQSGIVMDRNGDTIKLIDDTNKVVDSQSYFGVIGYFTAVGRSVDGAGVFIPCYLPTQGGPNNCPAPTPTNTPPPPPPTNIPEPTSTAYPTQVPLPTTKINPPEVVTVVTANSVSNSPSPATLGATDTKPTISKNTIGALLAIFISILWIIGISMYYLGKKHSKS